MAKNIISYLFCYDDHRAFAEDVKKRFSDNSRYSVVSFPTKEELIDHLEKVKENSFCKIAILALHDNKEQISMIERMTIEIKKIDKRTGLILVCPPDKMEDVKKQVKYNIDAFIPKNSNSILRIHNTVKKLISEHNIGVFKKRRNFSLYVLFLFIVASALLTLIAYFKFPRYF